MTVDITCFEEMKKNLAGKQTYAILQVKFLYYYVFKVLKSISRSEIKKTFKSNVDKIYNSKFC